MADRGIAQFFEKYIQEVCEGKGYRDHKNPAIPFTRKAKSGGYDRLTDEEYMEALDAVEILSSFFLDKPEAKSQDILRVILEDTALGEQEIRKIAAIMASCYTPHLDRENEYGEYSANPQRGFSRIVDTWEEKGNKAGSKGAASSHSSAKKQTFYGKAGEVLQNPRSIYEFLCEYIYGQDAAKRAAAMLLANHIAGKKRNMVFAGPTGCGKTEIWRTLAKVYPYIKIVDSSRITCEGWKGSYKMQDLFADMQPQDAGRTIFVFDEADKLFEPKYTSKGDNTSFAIQNELLKLMEGDMFNYKPDEKNVSPIDTSGISFVFCGSFERMVSSIDENVSEQSKSIGFGRGAAEESPNGYERAFEPMDLVKYAGVRQEIAGRIDEIIQLYAMEEEDYLKILADEKISPIRNLERQYEMRIIVSDAYKKALAKGATESEMGVRFLTSRLRTRLDDFLFDNWDAKEITLG